MEEIWDAEIAAVPVVTAQTVMVLAVTSQTAAAQTAIIFAALPPTSHALAQRALPALLDLWDLRDRLGLWDLRDLPDRLGLV